MGWVKTFLPSIIHFETRFPRAYLLAESQREDNYLDEQVEGKFWQKSQTSFSRKALATASVLE